MCTVSIIRLPGDVIRLACNRDEQRSRQPALPPRVVWCGRRRAIMPIDPTGGGTWIAANDAGLVMALLNVNSPLVRAGPAPVSRGRIIPSLMGHASVSEALAAAQEIEARAYGPLRLLILERDQWGELISDGDGLRELRGSCVGMPLLRTSSGLGDEQVEAPRRQLFEVAFFRHGASAQTQDALHRHQWADRPHLSVCMARPDARTVSYTVIEMNANRVHFRYHPAAPDEPATDLQLTLQVQERAAGTW